MQIYCFEGKTNPRAIALDEEVADNRWLRSLLLDWGYSEREIQRFVNEMTAPSQRCSDCHNLAQYS